MAKVVSPLICTVEVIGKPKESSYGNGFYHPVLFLDEARAGDEAKIWKSLSGEEVSQLMKGDRVQLVPAGQDKNGNPKHNIVVLNSEPSAAAPTTHGLSADQKRAIASFGTDIIAAYTFLYKQAKEQLEPLGASEETIRSAASGALIACQRKLGLDR